MTTLPVDLEPEPPFAAELFGDRLPVVRDFVTALAREGELRGLIGPAEYPRLWTRHIVNSGLLVRVLPDAATVADVGSGAGLPGLVVAAARPDLRITLIEPMERRTDWLGEQVAALDLRNVDVLRGRAEEAERGVFDVVTARAVGALTRLLPITARLARPGGELILLKGAAAADEIKAASAVIRRLGLRDVRVELLAAGMAAIETRVVRATVP